MQTVEAHAAHVWVLREQVSSLAQAGQGGAPGGHWRQRRKMVRRVFSIPAGRLVAAAWLNATSGVRTSGGDGHAGSRTTTGQRVEAGSAVAVGGIGADS